MNRPLPLILLTGVVGVLVPLDAAGQTPRIQFRTNTYDFGRVSQGTVVRAEFAFTNTGNALLEITDVQPGCGCTAAGDWSRQLKPGEVGFIPLQFNTAGFFGPVHKSATVSCNDTSQPSLVLSIVGEIWRPVELTPSYVLFNVTSARASNQIQSVRITNNLAAPLAISELKSSHSNFAPVLREIRPGKEFELQIHLLPPIPSGSVQGVITAKTSSPDLPMMSVTAMSILQPPVSVFPNIVTLQPGPLPAPTAVPFRMFVNPQSLATNQTVQFTNPAVNLSNVTVNVLEESPGRMAAVTLTFPAGLYLAPGTPAEFTIQTTHPDMPVIKVPITQMAKLPVVSVPGAPGPIPAPAVNPAGRSTQRPAAPVSAPPPSPPEIVLPGAPSSDK